MLEDVPWKLAAIHARDWLVKTLLMTVILGVCALDNPSSSSGGADGIHVGVGRSPLALLSALSLDALVRWSSRIPPAAVYWSFRSRYGHAVEIWQRRFSLTKA
jgi:hypothetical protein